MDAYFLSVGQYVHDVSPTQSPWSFFLWPFHMTLTPYSWGLFLRFLCGGCSPAVVAQRRLGQKQVLQGRTPPSSPFEGIMALYRQTSKQIHTHTQTHLLPRFLWKRLLQFKIRTHSIWEVQPHWHFIRTVSVYVCVQINIPLQIGKMRQIRRCVWLLKN